MTTKKYDWAQLPKLEDHTRRKHKILREYFFEYLIIRCQHPQQEKFRLAVVDGFAGGGRYECGAGGSPIIFIEELRNAVEQVNLDRATQGMKPLEIECLIVLNDSEKGAIDILKNNIAPLQAEINENVPRLHTRFEYINLNFEEAYHQRIKKRLAEDRYTNVIFNLDQCGHSLVNNATIVDMMRSYPSVEVFYTFFITTLLAFLQKSNPAGLAAQTRNLGIDLNDHSELDGIVSKREWLGAAERIVFESFAPCATFVSPFSINNPGGWRYWLIHFANRTRARQVYNDILHDNSSSQAHFGRSGLNMLNYDPQHENNSLYLFDLSGREAAKNQLLEDIPRLISKAGDVMAVSEFYESTYNATPAHSDDIHKAIIENPDIRVLTQDGGERRKAHTISPTDILKLREQSSFFPMFSPTNKA